MEAVNTYRAWMYDQFGYRFAFVMHGDYNVVILMAGRQAQILGATFDYLEQITA